MALAPEFRSTSASGGTGNILMTKPRRLSLVGELLAEFLALL